MQRLRPDDHFLILLEGDETPMHIGSLIVLEVPDADRAAAAVRLRAHLVERLAVTPLLRELRRAPLSFDSDVWVRAGDVDFDRHVVVHRPDAPIDDADLRAFVSQHVMIRLDLRRRPFLIHVLDGVGDRGGRGRVAMYVKVHHSVTDGVGFQTVLGLLSDDPIDPAMVPAPLRSEQELPTRHEWLAESVLRFRAEREDEPERRAVRRATVEALRDPALQRPATPSLSLSGPTSTRRAYTAIILPFGEMKSVARALDATVNDLFLALAGSAMRAYLIEIGDLPDLPLTTNSARSYRRPEHGPFGNRIVAIHPHLATHLADPIERLRAIQAAMSLEWRRTPLDEACSTSQRRRSDRSCDGASSPSASARAARSCQATSRCRMSLARTTSGRSPASDSSPTTRRPYSAAAAR